MDGGEAPVPACSTCHGDETTPAPPTNLQGETASDAKGVGAHRSHLNQSPTWHTTVACQSCHKVPTAVGDVGHIDDNDNTAELTFGARAKLGGASPSWGGTSCSGVYCHGATLTGGALTEPTWLVVDGTQAACGNCHGFPPPAPHSQSTDCGTCHPTIQPGTTTFLDPDSHINGVLDVTNGQACDACHGSNGNSAPPVDLQGNTATSARGVGAHQAHLGTSSWRREITCSQCHNVPVAVNDPGHLDGDDTAELTFGAMNPGASYNFGGGSCQNLYCHGNGWNAPGTETWTANLNLGCNGCHASDAAGSGTMSGKHKKHIRDKNIKCTECHGTVVNQALGIIAPALHVNGANNISMTSGGTYNPSNGRCSNMACHGNENW